MPFRLRQRRASLYASKAHNMGNSLPSGKIGLGEAARSASSSVQATQVVRHRVEAWRISIVRRNVSVFPTLTVTLIDDLTQALLVRQREFQKLDQAAQFRRDRNRRRSDDDCAPVGGEFLSHFSQPAHHDRIVHVAVKSLRTNAASSDISSRLLRAWAGSRLL